MNLMIQSELSKAREKEHFRKKVNTELILMYRHMGEYFSKHSENVSYGDAFVQRLADFFS